MTIGMSVDNELLVIACFNDCMITMKNAQQKHYTVQFRHLVVCICLFCLGNLDATDWKQASDSYC